MLEGCVVIFLGEGDEETPLPEHSLWKEGWLGDKAFLLGWPGSQCAISQRAGTPVERGLFDWK